MGITYKANIDDARNSKVQDIINKLQKYGIEAYECDDLANKKALENKQINFVDFDQINNVDLILFSVMNDEFRKN
ncbi:MAG: UDP binding domain-containing protein [Clostridia bacterium]